MGPPTLTLTYLIFIWNLVPVKTTTDRYNLPAHTHSVHRKASPPSDPPTFIHTHWAQESENLKTVSHYLPSGSIYYKTHSKVPCISLKIALKKSYQLCLIKLATEGVFLTHQSELTCFSTSLHSHGLLVHCWNSQDTQYCIMTRNSKCKYTEGWKHEIFCHLREPLIIFCYNTWQASDKRVINASSTL